MDIQQMIDARLVHELHTSERRSFRSCRRRWKWVFRDMYYPAYTAKPLEFGVGFHAAMETLYNPDTWSWPRDVVLNLAKLKFVEVNSEQLRLFKETRAAGFLMDGEAEADYQERVDLAVSMLDYYGAKVMPIVDHHWTPIEVEVEFLVAIQNPDNGDYLFCKCDQCWRKFVNYFSETAHTGEMIKNDPVGYRAQYFDGLPVVFGGRLDMLIEDEHGDLWVVDWKTAARISKDNDQFLYLDDQIGGYVMAMRRKLGLNVRGFIYVELRKAKVAAPQKNKQRRLGRIFSVNKQQAVTADLYLETVMEEDAEAYDAGLYDEYIDFLKAEGMEFHRRYQIMKSDHELQEIERMMWLEAQDQINPHLSIYPNPGKYGGGGCQSCAFQEPCRGMFAGEDVQWMLDESELFTKRTKHYWEEKIKSTDSRGGE